jgi:lipoyl(octanoyl) transferase
MTLDMLMSPLFQPQTEIEWRISPGLTGYAHAVEAMEARAEAIRAGTASEQIWLVEHAPLYTAGTSAHRDELVAPDRFPVHQAARGGRYTYHGPGQRVVYVMLDLKSRGGDVRAFVHALEAWVIGTLARFGLTGEIRDGRVGVWVPHPKWGEAKIAAIGIRLRRGVSFHGISINVNPDLEHFSGIIPCGISEFGVTSLADLGLQAAMSDLDMALKAEFQQRFGPIKLDVQPHRQVDIALHEIG